MSNLKKARVRAGLSQAELAAKSGCSLRAIKAYEQKERNIDYASIASVAALAHSLDCPICSIIESQEIISWLK